MSQEAASGTEPARTGVRAAVDVGGTFTDVFILGSDGKKSIAKVPSTANPIDAVMQGVEAAGVSWSEIDLFAHGTTIATNALITRRFPVAAMVTTKGFRDVLEIGRGTRQDPWDAYAESAPAYIRRRDRLTVSERMDYRGRVIEELDEAEAREVARILRKRGIKSVAVCFANAYANGANERRMAEILAEELGDEVMVTASHEIHPEIFEDDRFSTTVANAVLSPIIRPYARELAARTTAAGYAADVLLLHSGGGVMTPAMAERYAARLAASGIAAGAIASEHVARLCGFENSIGFDMGGTSTDVSLAEGGHVRTTKEWFVEWDHPICFPSIEVLTIGAGGGSLAWLDDAGALRNGPQSAGSQPGPACYGAGGTDATNTDANLILGRIGSELVGGDMTLDRNAAVAAMEKVAAPLGLDVEQAALATLRVACANMADAVRLISIGRGHDPREFALVAFGGAGPLHAVAVARELNIPTVLIPPNPGVTSAMGCLLVDVQHDLSQMFLRAAKQADLAEIEHAFTELETEGRERLQRDGVAETDMMFQRFVDMRYEGQWRSLAVPVPDALKSIDDAIATFQDMYQREHNFRREEFPAEIYRLTLKAVGVTPKPAMPQSALDPGALAVPKGTRAVRFDEHPHALETPLYDRSDLVPGVALRGPAVIDQFDSTTLVPPGTTASVDSWENIRIEIEEEHS